MPISSSIIHKTGMCRPWSNSSQVKARFALVRHALKNDDFYLFPFFIQLVFNSIWFARVFAECSSSVTLLCQRLARVRIISFLSSYFFSWSSWERMALAEWRLCVSHWHFILFPVYRIILTIWVLFLVGFSWGFFLGGGGLITGFKAADYS